jgi:hypothetical protein
MNELPVIPRKGGLRCVRRQDRLNIASSKFGR